MFVNPDYKYILHTYIDTSLCLPRYYFEWERYFLVFSTFFSTK